MPRQNGSLVTILIDIPYKDPKVFMMDHHAGWTGYLAPSE